MNSTTGKHGYREPCSRSSLCTNLNSNLTNLCFSFLVILTYDFSASSSWIFLRLLRSLRIPPVIPPAAPLDLSILLDLLGLLCGTVLLFSPDPQSRSTKDILCIGSAPVLTVCYCTNCKYLSFTSVELNYFSCICSLDEKDIKACGLFLPPDLVSPFWLFGSPSGDYSRGQFSIPGFVHSPRKIPVVLQHFCHYRWNCCGAGYPPKGSGSLSLILIT